MKFISNHWTTMLNDIPSKLYLSVVQLPVNVYLPFCDTSSKIGSWMHNVWANKEINVQDFFFFLNQCSRFFLFSFFFFLFCKSIFKKWFVIKTGSKNRWDNLRMRIHYQISEIIWEWEWDNSRNDLSLKQDQNLCNGAFLPFNSSSTLVNCFQISIRIPRIPCLPRTSWQAPETWTVAISCLCQANCFRKLLGLLQTPQNTPDKQKSWLSNILGSHVNFCKYIIYF